MRRESQVKVFRPKSLSGLLRLYGKNPESLIFSGGTRIIPLLTKGKNRRINFPEKVIYLGNIGEMFRISRSQRFLDMGACLPISRILSIGRHIIPRVVYEALHSIGNPSIRNLATIGGNICSPTPFNDSLSALNVVDARLELRSQSGTRWIPAGQFIKFNPGEVLTRIRIPLEEWDYQVFRKAGGNQSPTTISFAGTARFAKGILESFHFSIGGVNVKVFRNRDLEAQFEGSKLPVSVREIEAMLSGLDENLGSASTLPNARYRKETALRLFRWFIDNVNQKSIEIL